MTIEAFIEKLQDIQKQMPGAIMKYGDVMGPDISPVIECCEVRECPDLKFVCICDSMTELEIMFGEYERRLKAMGITEEAFYRDLLRNFTLEDVQRYMPDKYEHAKDFCEKNGLV